MCEGVYPGCEFQETGVTGAIVEADYQKWFILQTTYTQFLLEIMFIYKVTPRLDQTGVGYQEYS